MIYLRKENKSQTLTIIFGVAIMMLLFLVEEQVFTFFHDFKSVNIDLELEVFNSIQSLSIGDEYVIRGGAFGDTTVRRVHYNFSNGLCIVGEKVFYVLPNGDVDFERQIFTCHTLIYANGDGDHFTKNVFVKMGDTFDLHDWLSNFYSGVQRLDHYEEERYNVADLHMDVWRGE